MPPYSGLDLPQFCLALGGKDGLRVTTGLTNLYGNTYQIYVSPTFL